MKKETLDYILICLLLMLIASLSYFAVQIKSNGMKCLVNPVNYMMKADIFKNTTCICDNNLKITSEGLFKQPQLGGWKPDV